MKGEIIVKQEQIVEAALRRFSHFGISKTTLTEVAGDMAVTKQVLSYYFPDKQSLVEAVIDKLTVDYLQQLKEEMERTSSVKAALLKLTRVKGLFFEKYFMLVTQANHLEMMKNQAFRDWRQKLTAQEAALLCGVFEAGVIRGELKPLDASKTGELLLETLYAFSRCVKEKGGLPDAEAFRDVLAKQQEVINLFYQGLKREEWVN
jgi:TetR/AcrR family transcriptional repressor of mexJK operon